MISIPNMVMIGATGRNTGKTMLAAELIRHLRREHHVIGIKVTAVGDRGEPCPRGGQGCGVCTSLTDPFEIFTHIKINCCPNLIAYIESWGCKTRIQIDDAWQGSKHRPKHQTYKRKPEKPENRPVSPHDLTPIYIVLI